MFNFKPLRILSFIVGTVFMAACNQASAQFGSEAGCGSSVVVFSVNDASFSNLSAANLCGNVLATAPSVTLGNGLAVSDDIFLSDFGFNIPPTAKITSIRVAMTINFSGAAADPTVIIVPTNGPSNWGVNTIDVPGGLVDFNVISFNLSASDINDSSFGLILNARDGDSVPMGGTYKIYEVLVTVSFTAGPDVQLIPEGSTIGLSTATASSYQWQKDGVNLSDGGKMSGAASQELLIANITAADNGVYRCLLGGAVWSPGQLIKVSNAVTLKSPGMPTGGLPFAVAIVSGVLVAGLVLLRRSRPLE